jgi:hypothetical protein
MQRQSDTRLSRPDTKAGRLQRACLAVLAEHEADGAIPTSNRFIFYELVQRGEVPKHRLDATGRERARKPSQDVADATLRLREQGIVPWTWIVDETRDVDSWEVAPSVREGMRRAIERQRIDPWDGRPPLLLVESRSLAGVLRELAYEYVVPIASTNGQVGGFLHVDVAPLLADGDRVLYLGDLDLAGAQIEQNTRAVLSDYADLEWERLALLPEQVERYDLPAIVKKDRRYRDGRPHEAVETEALSQRVIVGLVRDALDTLLPEPLQDVRVREQAQREAEIDKLNTDEEEE